jgi:hypothetical protein
LGEPLPTQYFSLDPAVGRDRGGIVIGIQTVARQLIGKGDINMGRKAKKFTKIEAKFGCPLWVIS